MVRSRPVSTAPAVRGSFTNMLMPLAEMFQTSPRAGASGAPVSRWQTVPIVGCRRLATRRSLEASAAGSSVAAMGRLRGFVGVYAYQFSEPPAALGVGNHAAFRDGAVPAPATRSR